MGRAKLSRFLVRLLASLFELPDVRHMKALRRILIEEHGGEVIEYVLIAGLIVVAAIAVIAAVGTKVLARWNIVDSGL